MKFFQYLSALFHLIESKHFTTYFSQFFVQLMGRTLYIKEQRIKSDVVHYYETGFYVGKERYWEHVASNDLYTCLFVHFNRGREAHGEDIPILLDKYYKILQLANLEEPPPMQRPRGKPKQSKGRNLFDRLTKHHEAVLAFAAHKNVPFTNNQAERDIRPTKSKMKASGCFRTCSGAEIYARVQSFYSTIRKQGLNPFEELFTVLSGGIASYRVQTR